MSASHTSLSFPIILSTSSCAFFSTIGLLNSSAIVHSNEMAVVSVAAVK